MCFVKFHNFKSLFVSSCFLKNRINNKKIKDEKEVSINSLIKIPQLIELNFPYVPLTSLQHMKSLIKENNNFKYGDQINQIQQKFNPFIIGLNKENLQEPVLVLGHPLFLKTLNKFNIW